MPKKEIPMRINPITTNYQQKYYSTKPSMNTPNFQGKHTAAKFLGGTFGTIATLGGIAGTILLSGGVAIPAVLAYGALGAASGAIIGHQIDKGSKDKNIDKLA